MCRRRCQDHPLRSPVPIASTPEQAQDTRQRILDAAAGLFVANGYTGTTVIAVAAEAGVVPATIYGTLGGKRGLLEGVIDMTIIAQRGPLLDGEHEPRVAGPRSTDWAQQRIGYGPGASLRARSWPRRVRSTR